MTLENSSTNVNKQDILKRPLDLYISKKKSALTISLILLCRSGFQEKTFCKGLSFENTNAR